MEVIVTDNNAKEFFASELPIVIDFSATWCGPCRQLAPVIDELAKEYDGRILVGKCDIEDAVETTDEYNIRNVPTVLFIKNDQVVNKFVGSKSKADVQKYFEDLLA